jgi:glutamate synthase domain-containing protein 2
MIRLAFTLRFIVYTLSILLTAVLLLTVLAYPPAIDLAAVPLAVFAGFTVLGTRDLIQTRHAVLRNYPISAHLRFLLEQIRPEMRQYFFEDEKDGRPFSRDKRAVVYQRASVRDAVRRLCARVRVGPPFDHAAAARSRAVPRQNWRTGLPEAL